MSSVAHQKGESKYLDFTDFDGKVLSPYLTSLRFTAHINCENQNSLQCRFWPRKQRFKLRLYILFGRLSLPAKGLARSDHGMRDLFRGRGVT